MRRRGGTIDASSEQDHQLLRQVLLSQFITHGQLWAFLRDRCIEMNRRVYWWRVRRLIQHGLLKEQRISGVGCDPVYCLTGGGLTVLQSRGTFYADSPATIERKSSSPHVAHAITLNEIHLRLLKAGCLEEWVHEIEIRSINEFTTEGYVKDYDAVVTLNFGGERTSFGLEYERWGKSAANYAGIVARLRKERRVDRLLYLVPGAHLRSFLMQCFSIHRAALPIYIGVLGDLLRRDPRTLVVIEGSSWRTLLLSGVRASESSGGGR